MNIEYRKRQLSEDGIGPEEGPFNESLGYMLFVEQACYFGVLPPINILNKMFVGGSIVSGRNIQLLWSSFELSATEYEELKKDIIEHPEWGGEIDGSFTGLPEEWGHWALVRSIDKIDHKR